MNGALAAKVTMRVLFAVIRPLSNINSSNNPTTHLTSLSQVIMYFQMIKKTLVIKSWNLFPCFYEVANKLFTTYIFKAQNLASTLFRRNCFYAEWILIISWSLSIIDHEAPDENFRIESQQNAAFLSMACLRQIRQSKILISWFVNSGLTFCLLYFRHLFGIVFGR